MRISLPSRGYRASFIAGVLLAVAGVALTQSSSVASTSSPSSVQPPTTLIDRLSAELAQIAGQSVAAPVPESTDLPDGTIGPGSPAQAIKALQLRLGWAGLPEVQPTGSWNRATTAAVKRFQWRYAHQATGISDPKLTTLVRSTARDGQLDPRCLGRGITLCVDKTQKVTRYVKDGKTLKIVASNFGPDKGNPKFGLWSFTREGVFRIFHKGHNEVSSLYGYQMPYYMAFSGGEGFHYSDYFRTNGYKDVTQGCVTLNDRAASKWLYQHTPMKTKVVVHH